MRTREQMMSLFRSFSTKPKSSYHTGKKCTDDNADDDGACTSLTVWRKSLLFDCNGFTVIDTNGDLAYRVDNNTAGRAGEVVLMDGYGKSVLSIHRRRSLLAHDCWLIYEGGGESAITHDLLRSSDKSSSFRMHREKRVIPKPPQLMPSPPPVYLVKKKQTVLKSINNNNHMLAEVYLVGMVAATDDDDSNTCSSSSSRLAVGIRGSRRRKNHPSL